MSGRELIKPIPLLERIRSVVAAAYGRRLQRVLLYGSEARGGAHNDSDIDVLILLDRVPDYGDGLSRCLDALYPLSLQSGRHVRPKPVDAQEYETLDCPLYRQVHREGVAA